MKTATRKCALLVIDVQESFRSRPYWQADDLPAFLANTQALIDRCRAEGIPVARRPRGMRLTSDSKCSSLVMQH